MMGEPVGQQDRLFYEFDLEDMVPGDHLLRRIAAALDLSWLRGEMKTHYSLSFLKTLSAAEILVFSTEAG